MHPARLLGTPFRRSIALAIVIAVLLAAGLLASTSGQEDDEAGAGRGRPRDAAPRACEGEGCAGIEPRSVRLGLHLTAGACEGRVPVSLPPGEAGPHDWATYVNQVQGGVHGRQIEVVLADDGGCRDGATAAAAELLDGVGVLALAGLGGWEEGAGAALAAAARQAPVAEPGGPAGWASMPTFHQAASGFDALFAAHLRYIIGPAGLNRPEARIGILHADVPEVADPLGRATGSVPAARVVATIPVTGRIDTTAALRRLQQTGADVVTCHCDPLAFIPFVAAADAAGFRPQYTFAGQGYDLDHVLAAFPPESTFTTNAHGISAFCHPDHPCAEAHRRAIAQVREGATLTQRSVRTLHTLELLIEPLRRVGPVLDRASYLAALGSLDGWTTGLTGTVDLASDRTRGVQAFAVYESPGPGSTGWRMTDVAGEPFRSSWGA